MVTKNEGHPGVRLKEDYLVPLKLTPVQLAKAIRVPPSRIVGIVNCRTPMTADTAMRLTRYLGGTRADTVNWLTMQALYDFKTSERLWARKVEREVKPRTEQLAEEQAEQIRATPAAKVPAPVVK